MKFEITNNSGVDLIFKQVDDDSKHIRFTPQTGGQNQITIKNGEAGSFTVEPTGHKCDPACSACDASKSKIHAYYSENGKMVENNYFKAEYVFSEYCGVSGNKTIQTYSSNWEFSHHKGNGTDKYDHSHTHKTPIITKGSPSTGNTFDSATSGKATISYP